MRLTHCDLKIPRNTGSQNCDQYISRGILQLKNKLYRSPWRTGCVISRLFLNYHKYIVGISLLQCLVTDLQIRWCDFRCQKLKSDDDISHADQSVWLYLLHVSYADSVITETPLIYVFAHSQSKHKWNYPPRHLKYTQIRFIVTDLSLSCAFPLISGALKLLGRCQ